MVIRKLIQRQKINKIQKRIEEEFPKYDNMTKIAYKLKKMIEMRKAEGDETMTDEIYSLASDIAFLTQDAVNRMARCRQALIENELKTAERHSMIAGAQIDKADTLNKILVKKIENNFINT